MSQEGTMAAAAQPRPDDLSDLHPSMAKRGGEAMKQGKFHYSQLSHQTLQNLKSWQKDH